MQLIEINNLVSVYRHLTQLIQLGQMAEKDPSPAGKNLAFNGWEKNDASLLNILLYSKRLIAPKGCLHVVYDDNAIVACSGAYISDFSSEVAIAGVRAYTVEDYRRKYIHADLIFPKQIEWAKAQQAKMLLLTFNSYNNWLYNFILRGSRGQATAFGLKFKNIYKQFKPHNKQVIVQGTPQYILKMPLEEGYEYNFKSIELN